MNIQKIAREKDRPVMGVTGTALNIGYRGLKQVTAWVDGIMRSFQTVLALSATVVILGVSSIGAISTGNSGNTVLSSLKGASVFAF